MIEDGAHGFASPVALARYGVAAGAGATFFHRERHAAQPMLPLELLAGTTTRAVAAIAVLVNVGFYGLIFVVSLYFQRTEGRSPLASGLCFAPMTAVVLTTNLLAGPAARRFGPPVVLVAGTLAAAVGYAGLLVVGPNTPFAELVAHMVTVGAGLGLVVPAMTTVMLASLPKERSGIASATLNTLRLVGRVIGVALYGALVTLRPHVALGLTGVLGCSIGTACAAAAVAVSMRRRTAEGSGDAAVPQTTRGGPPRHGAAWAPLAAGRTDTRLAPADVTAARVPTRAAAGVGWPAPPE